MQENYFGFYDDNNNEGTKVPFRELLGPLHREFAAVQHKY